MTQSGHKCMFTRASLKNENKCRNFVLSINATKRKITVQGFEPEIFK